MTENEMVGWHHRLNGHEYEQAPGDGDGQGGLGVLLSMGSRCATVHGVAKSQTQLNDSTATAVKSVPGEEHGSPLQYSCPENQPTGSQRAGHV